MAASSAKIRPPNSRNINHDADRVFMTLLAQLEREERFVSDRPSAAYAPAVFAKHPKAEGMNKSVFQKAMDRLFEAGKIKVEEVGPASKRRGRSPLRTRQNITISASKIATTRGIPMTPREQIGPFQLSANRLPTPFRRLPTPYSHTPPYPLERSNPLLGVGTPGAVSRSSEPIANASQDSHCKSLSPKEEPTMNTLIQISSTRFSPPPNSFAGRSPRRRRWSRIARPPFGAMNWLSPPSGVARSWEEALGGGDAAKRQQADHTVH